MACQRSQKNIKNKNVCRLMGRVNEKDIANAFENVSVPACREAIWQRLEEMLDAETGAGDLYGSSTFRTLFRNWHWAAVFLTVVVTLVLTTFSVRPFHPIPSRSFKQEYIRHLIDSLQLPSRRHVSTNSINNVHLPRTKLSQLPEVLTKKEDQMLDSIVISGIIATDSVVAEPPSIQFMKSERLRKSDSLTGRRVVRGVKGIADSSYKIIPQIKS